MATAIPIAVRSSNGVQVRLGPPDYGDLGKCQPVQSKNCRAILFSPDGKYFAVLDGLILQIIETDNWEKVAVIEGLKPYHIAFSPKGTYLMCWEQFTVSNANPQGKPNLHIYSVKGELIKSFVHKKQGNWEPQWSADEKLMARVVNTNVIFYEPLDFEKTVARIQTNKVPSYSLSPLIGTYYVLCNVPGTTGQPSLAKLFKYPKFEDNETLSRRTLFQSDRVDFYWNSKGQHALLLTTSEVDKTGSSYYGRQTLHFMGLNCDGALVVLTKEGPIHYVAWSPKNHEFCVVYGFMPAKATLFNLKCEPVHNFAAAPCNAIYYNPQGNILLLAGFGNLRGHVDVWDADERKLIGTCEAPDSTLLEWSPDGVHFLTATMAPRLRIGNGYKIWHHTGALLYEKAYESPEELYDVAWKKCPNGLYEEPKLSGQKVVGIASKQPQASKEAYRPPSARNRPPVVFRLDDDDDAQKPSSAQSKATMKQKKKRENRRAKKLEDGDNKERGSPSAASSVEIKLTGDPEKDKKLRNIKKKLDAINKLKEQQAEGKELEINQLTKIKAEPDLLKELKSLQL